MLYFCFRINNIYYDMCHFYKHFICLSENQYKNKKWLSKNDLHLQYEEIYIGKWYTNSLFFPSITLRMKIPCSRVIFITVSVFSVYIDRATTPHTKADKELCFRSTRNGLFAFCVRYYIKPRDKCSNKHKWDYLDFYIFCLSFQGANI